MKIGVPKENSPDETRVSLVPSSVTQLLKKKHSIFVESGAGLGSMITDEQFENAGAKIVKSQKELFEASDVILKVQPPTKSEVDTLKDGSVFIGFLSPFSNLEVISLFAQKKITGFSMEFIPRITRAQSMDALSSMATLSGYKAVMIAADNLPRIFPMLMTAAGTVTPATVVVLGAGVAGLQAIATARRLGAKVEAFDARPVVKEQIESLGASFIPMDLTEDVSTAGGYAKEQSDDFLRREQEAIGSRLHKADVVITTAQIFGKQSPVLITDEMLKLMPAGSVIVDIAAEQGGNCESTLLNQVVAKNGVFIHGVSNLPATLPVNASQMYSKNIVTLFLHLYGDEEKDLNFDDEIVQGACVTHAGEIRNKMLQGMLSK